MLENAIGTLYSKLKLSFYKKIFSRFETREASLTAVETFCVEVIYAMEKPTINQFAQFVNISQANAAYKVQSLIDKGYVDKLRSKTDKREYNLLVTERFHLYNRVTQDYVREVTKRMCDRFTKKEIELFEGMLSIIANELMPEVKVR